MPGWQQLIPGAFGALGALGALLFDAWERPAAAIAAACTLLAGGALYAVTSLGPELAWEGAAAAACLVLTALILAGGSRMLLGREDGGRLVTLSAFVASAAAVVALATDVVMLLVAVEVLSVAGFGIVAAGGDDRAREATVKWFVQSAVATVVFVSGVAVLLWSSPESGAGGFGARSGESAAVGVALVLSALAFKAGSFPFHAWVPDAYEAAPPLGAAVLASVGKIATLTAIARLAATAGAGGLPLWSIAALATASIVFGNLAALRQTGLARMLAYSAVAQVGYGLVAVTSPRTAVPAVVVFSIAYGIAVAAGFLFVEASSEGRSDRDGAIRGLAGLSSSRPGLAVAATVVMLSLTGIPLTAGFWGKLAAFGAAVSGGWAWLAIVGAIGSVVSFGYYGGVVRAVYLEGSQTGEPAATPVEPRTPVSLMTVAFAALIVTLGLAPLLTGFERLLAAVFG